MNLSRYFKQASMDFGTKSNLSSVGKADKIHTPSKQLPGPKIPKKTPLPKMPKV